MEMFLLRMGVGGRGGVDGEDNHWALMHELHSVFKGI